jgi:hypothetical protein
MSDILIRWMEAEKNISELKTKKAEIEAEITKYDRELEAARGEYTAYMKDNGLTEDEIIGEYVNYKISFSKPRGNVKCEPSAVPDEFCDIVRKPRLKEIREYLEENTVNWAAIEFAEPTLSYKVTKKG